MKGAAFVIIALFFMFNMIIGIGFSDDTKTSLEEHIEVSEFFEVYGVHIINEESETYQKSELDKLFEVMQKNEKIQWHQGDILIASATILAFFGFASFLTAQFRGKNQDRRDFLKYLDIVLVSIFCIQIIQLIAISIVIAGVFHWRSYFAIIIITGILLLFILINSRKIISLQNSGETKRMDGSDMVKRAKEKYTHKMLRQARQAKKELEKFQRKQKKL